MKSADWVASAGLGVRQPLTGQSNTPTMGINGISGSSFTVSGVGGARTVAVFTAGITARISQRLSLEVSYEGQYGSRTRNNAVTGKLDWSF